MRALLIFAFASSQLIAGEMWLFLKDGNVGTGNPADVPIALKLADGKILKVSVDEISFKRTREEVDVAVAQMVADIAKGKNLDQHAKRFVVLKNAATSKLLECLKHPDSQMRLSALFALQYCFAPEALAPVYKALSDADKDIQKAAWQVLMRNVPEIKLAELVKSFADDDDIENAAIAFECVDKYYPDASLKRIQRLMRNPPSRSIAVTRLSHYRSPKLTADTLALLNSFEPNLRRGAIVGLISQLADPVKTRADFRALLPDAGPELREIAGEYFTWTGERFDLPLIRELLKTESDIYTRASLESAMSVIKKRADLWTQSPLLSAEFDKIRNADVLEPTFVYSVNEHAEKLQWRERAFRLQEVLAGPSGPLRESREQLSSVKMPVADAWIPPVRDYYDSSRKSFGFCVTKDFTSFVGRVHIGDDVGWNKELRTVVAAAPGIVRSVSHVFSWGFIVVIEHQLSDGASVCSLYAHLSPMLHVKPGDVVKAGQKIGSTGRSHSVENGGYNSHLHFGLHRGAYGGGDWVCGYISQTEWAADADGWIDPQAFLKAHDKKSDDDSNLTIRRAK